MKGYNLIVVFNEASDRVLMCRRKKEPYKGLLNFVGGKIERNEEGLAAAYRELNFYDKSRYAGGGNIGYIMTQVENARDKLLR